MLLHTNKIVFISDFFLDEILGGAEKCNATLIEKLQNKYTVNKIKSSLVDCSFLEQNKNNTFIVANFFHLAKDSRQYMIENLDYIIYEHDHKYVASNNPALYKNFLSSTSGIINKQFYKSAMAVVCQSRLHSKALYQNLLISNIVNAGANFWSEEDLNTLSTNLDKEKDIEYAIFASNNKNKGTPAALKYCAKNNIEPFLLPHVPYKEFIGTLSRVKKLIFFPQWLESYSRVAVEAKILGCTLVTNGLLGVSSEPYFSLRGKELLNKLKTNNNNLLRKINKIIEKQPVNNNFDLEEIPKITISCSLYKGEKYIRGFLEDIVKQTIFDKCELIIVNANSPENEEPIIFEFMKRYKNIKYHRLDYRATTTEVINMVLKDLGTGEYVTVGNVDDRRREDCLEVQAKHLTFSKDIDLVYGDCLQTTVANETFDKNSSTGNKYEHSLKKFSRHNMIKCLPGPMPMWKRKLHQKYGYFSSKYKFANDWDMWLRMVNGGCAFKKIHESIGLYYFNDEGNSTSIHNFKDKIKEENSIFQEYKEIFGEENYNRYRAYFEQAEKL